MRHWLFIFLIFPIMGCQTAIQQYSVIAGVTMGTTYNIIFEGGSQEKIQEDIDNLLIRVNLATSTYEENSLISKFNNDYDAYRKTVDTDTELTHFFIDNFKLSKSIFGQTGGAFDPTVMPLVNYWGFGYKGRDHVVQIDTVEIQRLLTMTGLDKLSIQNNVIEKTHTAIELDFSGIAKGYGVDQIAKLLESKNIQNYYIEIGGEVFAKGVNKNGKTWRTGISIPSESSGIDDYQQIIEISNKGIATSGNYRNYYEVDGKVFSHTINPKTGFPERNDILSSTIIAKNCALADGYATACMVLGFEKAKNLIVSNNEIEGILIYLNEVGALKTFDSTKNSKDAQL